MLCRVVVSDGTFILLALSNFAPLSSATAARVLLSTVWVFMSIECCACRTPEIECGRPLFLLIETRLVDVFETGLAAHCSAFDFVIPSACVRLPARPPSHACTIHMPTALAAHRSTPGPDDPKLATVLKTRRESAATAHTGARATRERPRPGSGTAHTDGVGHLRPAAILMVDQ